MGANLDYLFWRLPDKTKDDVIDEGGTFDLKLNAVLAYFAELEKNKPVASNSHNETNNNSSIYTHEKGRHGALRNLSDSVEESGSDSENVSYGRSTNVVENAEVLEKTHKLYDYALRSVSLEEFFEKAAPNMYKKLPTEAKQPEALELHFERTLSVAKECVEKQGTPTVQEDSAREFFRSWLRTDKCNYFWVEWGVTMCTYWSSNIGDFYCVLNHFTNLANARRESREKGFDKGFGEGWDEGYDTGADGKDECFKAGFREGKDEVRRHRALTSINIVNGRNDRGINDDENYGQPYVRPDQP